jgi:maltooligosyltrehalose trehalohydrolase
MNASRFGAGIAADGTTFRLWAPAAKSVELLLDRPVAMSRQPDGWFVATVSGAGAGTLYKYRIDGDLEVPDPAARFQPDDVSGPSEVIDHATYRWRADTWKGRPWHEAVILEAHVGTFTAEGSYLAMIDKLDHLVATGITVLELMPLNDFSGRRNWGYDGVLWYAPDSSYGRPDDLKTLIDAAHLRGLMVFLDVVYNHFGPEGNYLGRYAPAFFTKASTPWGAAIDYSVPQVRDFAIESALHWLQDFRFDGLRLDAAQEITTAGDRPLLHDLSAAVGDLARASGRHIHLVLENDDNRASLLAPLTDPPDGRYRAQWNDDYHHAWHVLLTGERGGYYRDYAADPDRSIDRALASGFAYQGEASLHRSGRSRGQASGALSPLAFINFLQNHDQIGNRALGDRLVRLAKPAAIEAALAITLLAPMPPMLFMGEEWGAQQPFPFFCDFRGDLAKAVRNGRRHEFQSAYETYGSDVPDPLDPATFESAKLDWQDREQEPGRSRLALVRQLLAIRQREITPHLIAAAFDTHCSPISGPILAVSWTLGAGRTLRLLTNLSDEAVANSSADHPGLSIWGGDAPSILPPWSVFFGLT